MNSDEISTSKQGKVSTKRRPSSSSDSSSGDDKVASHKRKKTKLIVQPKKRRNTSKHKYKKGKSRSSSSDSSTSEDSSTSSSSDSSSSSSSSSEEERRRRKKKQKMKLKNKMDKKKAIPVQPKKSTDEGTSNDIPLALMDQRKSLAPMTKEEWEKRQSVVKRVYDETTGRHRLIKGDGEVIEEIVSKERHKEINKQATKGDGEYFQSQLRKM